MTIIQPRPTPDDPRPTTHCEYGEHGNGTVQTDALGRTTRYEYNNFDRLVTETADCAHLSLAREHAAWCINTTRLAAKPLALSSSLRSLAARSSTATLDYDRRGQLISKGVEQPTSAGTIDFHLDYEYDDAGNLTGILSSNEDGAAALYTHDELNHLATVEDRDGGLTDYSGTCPARAGNAVGSLEGYTYPNQVSTTFTYDSLNRLTNLQSARAGSSSPLADYHYTLRPSGHRSTVFEQNGRRIDYSYDGLYRLTDETVTNDAWNVNGSVGYTHDLVGNRLMRTSTLAGVEGQTFAFDVNDRIDAYAYDNAGNTTGGEGRIDNQPGEFTDTYDFQHRLIRRVWDDGTEVELRYDTFSNRTAKTVTAGTDEAEALYIVDDRNPTGWPQVLEEHLITDDQQPITNVVYTYGHDLISQTRSNGIGWRTHFYGEDGHGNVRYLTDYSGEITDLYDGACPVLAGDAFSQLPRQNILESNGAGGVFSTRCNQQPIESREIA